MCRFCAMFFIERCCIIILLKEKAFTRGKELLILIILEKGLIMNKKPIIGIISKYKNEDDVSVYINDNVKNAVVENGGIAIGILPPLPNKKNLDGDVPSKNCLTAKQRQDFIAQIKLCDGIIFEGGPTSMEYEPVLANYIFKHNIPTLGFCAGQNNLVRGVGGTTKPVDNV